MGFADDICYFIYGYEGEYPEPGKPTHRGTSSWKGEQIFPRKYGVSRWGKQMKKMSTVG